MLLNIVAFVRMLIERKGNFGNASLILHKTNRTLNAYGYCVVSNTQTNSELLVLNEVYPRMIQQQQQSMKYTHLGNLPLQTLDLHPSWFYTPHDIRLVSLKTLD